MDSGGRLLRFSLYTSRAARYYLASVQGKFLVAGYRAFCGLILVGHHNSL